MSARARGAAALLLVLGTAGVARPADGQDRSWRTLDVTRQLHDSSPLLVRLDYQTGTLSVRAAAQPLLFAAHVRYDAAQTRPVYDYVAATRTLKVGVDRRDERGVTGGGGELRLDLTRRAPLDLELRLGAARAELELGGLRIDHLKVEAGASEAVVRFDTPNPQRMRAMSLEAGAASLTASRLANANADHIRVQAGVGGMELDFGGAWTQDIELSLDVTLGTVVLHVPRDVGVLVETSGLLTRMDREGLVKRGDGWASENWETARHHLRVRGSVRVGRLSLDRTD